MRILREPAVLDKVGVGRTKFREDWIATGKARWCKLGKRANGMPAPLDYVRELKDFETPAQQAILHDNAVALNTRRPA